MAEAGFTKGPWVYQGGQIYAVPAEPLDATTDDEPLCIADRDMDTRIDFDTEGEANARLIAASPCLYEALKELLEYVTPAVRNNSDFSVSWRVAERKARAALLKATGEAK